MDDVCISEHHMFSSSEGGGRWVGLPIGMASATWCHHAVCHVETQALSVGLQHF